MTARLRYGAIAVALALLVTLPLWMGNSYYINIASQILLFAVFALALNVLVGYAGLVSLGHAGLFAVAGYSSALLLQSGYGHLAADSAAIVITLVASAIFAALERDGRLHSRRIEVAAHGSQVELHGRVRTLAERLDAEEVARGVAGVTHVSDYLRVAP